MGHELKRPRTAFVLSMTANGLGIARTLGRRGVPVIGVDIKRDLPGLRSKFVRPLLSADIEKRPDAVLDLLAREAGELGEKGVLFPASDAAVLFMSRNRCKLADSFDFSIPSERIAEAMVNKRLQFDEAKKAGIPLNDVFYPRSERELDDVVRAVRFPAFIKPLYSHLWFPIFGNKGFVVTTPRELKARMAKVFASGLEVTVQSIIMPPGKNLYTMAAYLGRDGYVSPVFTAEKLRQYPPNFGVASLAESVHLPDVAELGVKFLKSVDYRGIGYVEFKRDPRDGGLKLIEVNPRTWMQNEHSDAAGLPLVWIEYLDLTGGALPSKGDFKDGVRWWDPMNDADSFWRLRRRGAITVRQWVRSWRGSEVKAFYAPDDPRPALYRAGFGLNAIKLAVDLGRMKVDDDAVPEAPEDRGRTAFITGNRVGKECRDNE